ncbi:MAG: Calx-beta domain-containing protein [Pyrinomonadaceae bacterium]
MPSSSSAPAAAEREIQYRSFGGATYALHAFDGRNVSYALPDSWLGEGALTRQEVDSLVENTDLAYTHMAELSGGEPRGAGLLTIAVVDTGTASGSGLIGAKGVELSPTQLTKLKEHLRAGRLPEEVLHELEHCFDLNNAYLSYWPDWRHAWTTFAVTYEQIYSRSGSLRLNDADLLDDKIEEYTAAWGSLGTGASWGRCVRDAGCPGVPQNEAWAGFMLRYARAHRAAAVLRAFAYLRDYRQAHPAPATAEGKNDLLIKALAAGAAADITCELDAWHWEASSSARAEISSLYHQQNALCLDQDSDGFSPLTGDADDRDPSTRPDAMESANRKDDDCDGIIDDVALTEQDDFPSRPRPNSATAQLPTRIKGFAEAGGQDSVQLAVPVPGLLKVRLRGRSNFHGWVGLTSADGLSGPQAFYSLTARTFSFVTDRAGQWVITITPDAGLTSSDAGGSGVYDLTLEAAAPRTAATSLSATPTDGSQLRLVATLTAAPGVSSAPTSVRFWVSPYGFVGDATVNEGTAVLDWHLPPTVPQTVALRAQPMRGIEPAAFPTAQVWYDTRSMSSATYGTDLSMTALSAPPSVLSAGDVLACGFEFSNDGPAAAENARINLYLDEGLSLLSSSSSRGTPSPLGGGVWSFNLGRVEAGEIVVLNIKAAASSTTTSAALSVTATGDTPETLPTNNTVQSRISIRLPPTPTPTPQPATFQFDSADYVAVEDCAPISVRVLRVGPTGARAAVDVSSDNGTATQRGDFSFVAGRLVFEPGESEKIFQVLVNEDAYAEGTETATLVLQNPTGGALGSVSAATLRILDDVPESLTNPIDDSRTFVRTHYHDFLYRQSDQSGEDFWTRNIESCGEDARCRAYKRAEVSTAFFLSIEFQQTGYLVMRAHKAAFGVAKNTPRYSVFLRDQREVGEGVVVGQAGWSQRLDANKNFYLSDFVSRPEFVSQFPRGMAAAAYVDKLFTNTAATPTDAERGAAVAAYGEGDTTGRAAALGIVADSDSVYAALYNPSFVLMQYYGYLRRNPDDAPDLDFTGYDFWLAKMNSFSLPGENVRDESVAVRRVRRAEMVRAFVESLEYRGRFAGSGDRGDQLGPLQQTSIRGSITDKVSPYSPAFFYGIPAAHLPTPN